MVSSHRTPCRRDSLKRAPAKATAEMPLKPNGAGGRRVEQPSAGGGTAPGRSGPAPLPGAELAALAHERRLVVAQSDAQALFLAVQNNPAA